MQLSWPAFLARYGAMAHSIARAITGSTTEADDLTQEAVLALVRASKEAPERFETDAHARNYFLRAVRNLARKSRRDGRPGRSLEATDPPATRDGDPDLEAVRERQHRLGQLVRGLAPDERALIVDRFLRRKTLAELSVATGLAISTLHAREKALLARLRARLERDEGGAG